MAWSESGRIVSYSMVGEMLIARVLGTFGIPVNKARTLMELCVIMAQLHSSGGQGGPVPSLYIRLYRGGD